MARLTQEQWWAFIDEHASPAQTAVEFCAERSIDSNYLAPVKSSCPGCKPQVVLQQ